MVKKKAQKKPQVALFATCLVDLIRPSVGFAAAALLEQAGFEVVVPEAQTCCGQPAYNSGAKADARALAKKMIEAFEGFAYVVAPSGSCAAMLKLHYPALLADDPVFGARAEDLGTRVFELCDFLTHIAKFTPKPEVPAFTLTYHDSCAGLRELGIKDQPRALLKSVAGVTLVEMKDSETCCGFGGTFCVKFADISNDMVSKKTAVIEDTAAGMVVAGELGCLMNIAGKLQRIGSDIAVRHIAEVLAGRLDNAPIGESGDG